MEVLDGVVAVAEPTTVFAACAAALGIAFFFARTALRRVGHCRELKSLRRFKVLEVLQAEENGSSVVLLGTFPFLNADELAIIKLSALSLSKADLLRRLQGLRLRLKSESGAEYAYYDGTLSASRLGLLGTAAGLLSSGSPAYHVEVIAPASPRQISRCRPVEIKMITETAELYTAVTAAFEAAAASDGALGWVFNVLSQEKEKERVLFNDDVALINVDTKWRNHPDPLTVPREQWRGHPSVSNLYVLAFAHERGITSLRSLRGDRHLPMLRHIYKKGLETIEEVYGVKEDQLRVCVHYQPQFHHFHVHFTRLSNEWGFQAEHAVLLQTIIHNLEVDPEYYAKAPLQYRLPVNSPLYMKLQEHWGEEGGDL